MGRPETLPGIGEAFVDVQVKPVGVVGTYSGHRNLGPAGDGEGVIFR